MDEPMTLSAKPYLRAVSLDRKARVDFDSYPFAIPVVRGMGVLELHRDVTFFVGENGTGKSTVLQAIAVGMGLPAEGGARQQRFRMAGASPLCEQMQLVKGSRMARAAFFLRADSARNVLSAIDADARIDHDDTDALLARSHGESFMELLLGLQDDGFYVLDEPEAALSPSRQLAALAAIHGLVQRGCQFVIATHSPILLSYPKAKILAFDDSGIQETAYEDTEHYAVTRDYLNHYQRRLEQLLGDEEEPE
jgi:predicted ATPase